MPPDHADIGCCFDARAPAMLDRYRRSGLKRSGRTIAAFLESHGLRGAESLEVGSGVGGLTLELARLGAAKAKGVDLSPELVRGAALLASEAGLQASASFSVGDGATAVLEPADFVVLDSVICCYPDPAALIGNTAAAARRFYAISLPDDRRRPARLLRGLLPLQRLILRRTSFRFFMHKTSMVYEMVEDSGLHLVHETRVGRLWCVAVFSRTASPTSSPSLLP